MIFAPCFKFLEQKYKILTIMAIPQKDYSFAPGLQKLRQLLPVDTFKKVNEDIYNLLGCTSRSQYSMYKRNIRNVPHHIYIGINEVFGRYGFHNPSDIWTIS